MQNIYHVMSSVLAVFINAYLYFPDNNIYPTMKALLWLFRQCLKSLCFKRKDVLIVISHDYNLYTAIYTGRQSVPAAYTRHYFYGVVVKPKHHRYESPDAKSGRRDRGRSGKERM